MKNLIMVIMLAVMGKTGVVPPKNAAKTAQSAVSLSEATEAEQGLVTGTGSRVIKRFDWARICYSAHAIQVTNNAANAAGERSLDSICRDLSYLQQSRFQYGDVYSDASVKPSDVEKVLYNYVLAVFQGDISESV